VLRRSLFSCRVTIWEKKNGNSTRKFPFEYVAQREFIEAKGCEILYLPPYSPDLNSIEETFSKIKALLRRAGARVCEALVEAIGRVLDAVTGRDGRGFFEHCGYRLPSQSLLQRLWLRKGLR
jgi:DDE superfamily endonuclease